MAEIGTLAPHRGIHPRTHPHRPAWSSTSINRIHPNCYTQRVQSVPSETTRLLQSAKPRCLLVCTHHHNITRTASPLANLTVASAVPQYLPLAPLPLTQHPQPQIFITHLTSQLYDLGSISVQPLGEDRATERRFECGHCVMVWEKSLGFRF